MAKPLATVAMLFFLCVPVLAQEQGPLIELTDGNASIAVLGLTVDQTVGKEVYYSEGNLLGKVDNVLGDNADTPTSVTVGGGRRNVVLELASAELIVTQLSVREYQGLPAFEE